MFFSTTSGNSICIPDEKVEGGKAPSKYFRRVFAEICNPSETNPFYNWKIPEEVNRSADSRNKIIQEAREQFKDKKEVLKIYNSKLDRLLKTKTTKANVKNSVFRKENVGFKKVLVV